MVVLTLRWARAMVGKASSRNLITALVRDRATAMRKGWQIKINHVESELARAPGHAGQRKRRWARCATGDARP